jgi:hypothetical protein
MLSTICGETIGEVLARIANPQEPQFWCDCCLMSRQDVLDYSLEGDELVCCEHSLDESPCDAFLWRIRAVFSLEDR